jgi:D-glycero-D-manno-heptose 1,7-bisphosphate phosphatase
MTDMLDIRSIDKTWTLFLDRDGVINRDKPNSYIFSWSEFSFYDGVLDSLAYFNKIFCRILVVTNQRGVGRGLMSEADLILIHQNMLDAVQRAKGRIDKIYYCITNEDNDPNRKPNPGMAFQARKDFPEIAFSKAIVVGNNISDMQFGRNAGMHTVFLKTTIPDITLPHPDIDLAFDSLADFAKALQKL